jgi:glycosyltransferase involved in cell wall biosynthesis
MRSFATDVMGFAPEQLTVLHNPVDRSRFRRPSSDQRAAARRALDVPPTASVVVTVGRIDRLKGIDLQIAAWPEVVAQMPHAVLLVVGDGPERAGLEHHVAGQPWARSVRFLGFRSDVEAILWAGDLFAITSRSEGLGLVALEAMSTGMPVVATAVDGLPEIVIHDVNGLVVAPEDPSAIANGIRHLLADAPRRERLAAGAEQQASTLDLARYAEKLEAIYHEVIARHGARRR